MKLIEMEGFLRGKCLPGDMKVNETNAEYLVRKFAEAEARCAALAAENAGLKSDASDCVSAVEHWNSWADAEDKISTTPETPATDAFLAEVRAQGVEAFASVLEARGKHHDYVEIANAYAALLRKGVQS